MANFLKGAHAVIAARSEWNIVNMNLKNGHHFKGKDFLGMTETAQQKIDNIFDNWNDNVSRCKDCFLRLKGHCDGLNGICLKWQIRPGISYSLRAAHPRQTARDLFAMVDIIDDDPANRWLSVCFYNDMVRDPDEIGDFVPGGLHGEDALCFEVNGWDEAKLAYLEARLSEACAEAAKGA